MYTNTPASMSSHDGWPQHMEPSLLPEFDFFQWPPVLDYTTNPSLLFSPFPSSSTSAQPVAPPAKGPAEFSTLAELLTDLLDDIKPSRETQLSAEHIQIATSWISNRFQSVSDIPERGFQRYADKWRRVANNILRAGTHGASSSSKAMANRKIPRPCNSFFLFKSVAVGALHTSVASQLWHALQSSEGQGIAVWVQAAKELDQMHKEIFPEYKFAPAPRSAKKTKDESKARTQAEPYKDALPRGGKKRRTSKTPTLLTQARPGPSDVVGEAMHWAESVGEYRGGGFELPGGSAEYHLGQVLPWSTTFDLLPDFPAGHPSPFDIGTPMSSASRVDPGPSTAEDWVREFNANYLHDLLRQAS